MNAPAIKRNVDQEIARAFENGIIEGERRAAAQWIETVIALMRTGRLVVPMPSATNEADQ